MGKLWGVTHWRLLAPPPEAVTDSNKASLYPTPSQLPQCQGALVTSQEAWPGLTQNPDLSKTHYSWLLVFLLTAGGGVCLF